jgi:hypothetical protein
MPVPLALDPNGLNAYPTGIITTLRLYMAIENHVIMKQIKLESGQSGQYDNVKGDYNHD